MPDAAARRSLGALVVLATLTIVTATAFVAVTYMEWSWLSALLGVAVAAFVVLCVHHALAALERWIETPASEPRAGRDAP
jgi:hypothetical protein